MLLTSKDITGLTIIGRLKDLSPKLKKEIYSHFSPYAKLVADGFITEKCKNKKVRRSVDFLIKFSKKELPQRGKFCPICGR